MTRTTALHSLVPFVTRLDDSNRQQHDALHAHRVGTVRLPELSCGGGSRQIPVMSPGDAAVGSRNVCDGLLAACIGRARHAVQPSVSEARAHALRRVALTAYLARGGASSPGTALPMSLVPPPIGR